MGGGWGVDDGGLWVWGLGGWMRNLGGGGVGWELDVDTLFVFAEL